VLTLTVTMRDSGNALEVRVHDNGTTIPLTSGRAVPTVLHHQADW
jgi:hypothetical protein